MEIESREDELAQSRMISELRDRVAEFEGRLGIDEMPSDGLLVEIYTQTQCSGMKPGHWTGWPEESVRDWHLWRPIYEPEEILRRSEEIRRHLGVIELEGNGFYKIP